MPERIFGALSKEPGKNGKIAAIFHKTGKDSVECGVGYVACATNPELTLTLSDQ